MTDPPRDREPHGATHGATDAEERAVERRLEQTLRDGPAGSRDAVWLRVEANLGPQRRRRSVLAGLRRAGHALGSPSARRLTVVGLASALLTIALLGGAQLRDNSAEAAVVTAAEDIAELAALAVADSELTAEELAALRLNAHALVRLIENDPLALRALDRGELGRLIDTLERVHADLSSESAGSERVEQVTAPLYAVAGLARGALAERSPAAQHDDGGDEAIAPLAPAAGLAAPADDERPSQEAQPAAANVATYSAGGLALVEVERLDGTLRVLAVEPAWPWRATIVRGAGEEAIVSLRLEDIEVLFLLRFDDGVVSTELHASVDAAPVPAVSAGTATPTAAAPSVGGTATPVAGDAPSDVADGEEVGAGDADDGGTGEEQAHDEPADEATATATATPTSGEPQEGETDEVVPAVEGTSTYSVVGVGNVTLELADGRLTILDAVPTLPEWAAEILIASSNETVEARFTHGEQRATFTAKYSEERDELKLEVEYKLLDPS